jgi:hypothetical protein
MMVKVILQELLVDRSLLEVSKRFLIEWQKQQYGLTKDTIGQLRLIKKPENRSELRLL